MRVLIVDDSVVIRRLVADALVESGIDVTHQLSDGADVLGWLERNPQGCDAIVMDVEMPRMSGLEATVAVRRRGITVPIIVFSTRAQSQEEVAAAKAAGATACVHKPANVGSVLETKRRLTEELIPTLNRLVAARAPITRLERPTRTHMTDGAPPRPAFSGHESAPPAVPSSTRASATPPVQRPLRVTPAAAMVVASSTGGPDALARFVADLPASLNVPVLIAQHMPASFTEMLAARLDRLAKLPVTEASNGEEIRPGQIYVAPGALNLRVRRDAGKVVCTVSELPVEIVRPSADELFSSAAQLWGAATLGVVLTGMGADGLAGSRAIVQAGGSILAQSEQTCVVWGMPRAVAEAGLADVLDLDALAAAATSRCRRRP